MEIIQQRSKPYQIDCDGNLKQVVYANIQGNLLQQIYQMHKIDSKINDNQAYNLKGQVIEQTEKIQEIQEKFVRFKNLRILYQELYQLAQEKGMDVLVKTSTLDIAELETQQNTYTFKTNPSSTNKVVQFSTDCFKESPMELNEHFQDIPINNNDINEFGDNIQFIDSENETSQSSSSNNSFQIESLQCINNNNNSEGKFMLLNKLHSTEMTPCAGVEQQCFHNMIQSTNEQTQDNTEILKRDQDFKKQSESTISNVSNCGSQHRLEDSELDQYDYHFNDSVDIQITMQERKISNFKQQIQEQNNKKQSFFKRSQEVRSSIKTAEASESYSVSPEARSRTVSQIVGGGCRKRRMSLNIKNLSVNINNSNFKRKNSSQIVLLTKSESEELQQQQ